MKLRRHLAGIGILSGLLLAVPALGQAQLPPHPPGSICVTPKGWCWVARRGPVGSACSCPTPYGPVGGQLS